MTLYREQLTTRAHATHCTHCGQQTIDAHAAGIPVHCDPQPLTVTDEIQARLNGQLTYTLTPKLTGHLELLYRDPHRIRAAPPTAIVLATHLCPGNTLPAQHIRRLPPPVPLTTRHDDPEVNNDEPPF